LQNERKTTPVGLRLLLTFDNVKNTRTALEFMELLGENKIMKLPAFLAKAFT
jgi:hypothetical protein